MDFDPPVVEWDPPIVWEDTSIVSAAIPTLFDDLRARVRERGAFLAGDPTYPDAVIDRQINVALGTLDSANPSGWWWNEVEVDYFNNTGLDAEYISAEEVGQFHYQVKSQRVGYVFVSRDGDNWQLCEQRTTSDATRLTGGRMVSDGLPAAWSAVQGQGLQTGGGSLDFNGAVIRFSPPLPSEAHVRFSCLIGGPDLDTGDAVFQWPAIWMDAVVEQATATLARQRRIVGSLSRRSQLSQQKAHQVAADEWLKALLVYANRPYEGPASGTLVQDFA